MHKYMLSVLMLGMSAFAEKPNILFIMTDDLGWADVGFHNKGLKTTPFLDQLVKSKNAAELINHYATHRCSPSRAQFLTGKYAFRFGMGNDALVSIMNPGGLPADLTILPQELKKVGYTSHMVGKWHLGASSDH